MFCVTLFVRSHLRAGSFFVVETMVSRDARIRAWPFTHRRVAAHGMESLCEACPCETGLHMVGADRGNALFFATVVRGANVPSDNLAICSQQRLYGSDLLSGADRSVSVWRLLAGLPDGARDRSGLTGALGSAIPG